MISIARITAVLVLIGHGHAVSAQSFQPLTFPVVSADERMGFFIRCSALAKSSWAINSPSFAKTLDLDSKHPFFALSRDRFFSKSAHTYAFEAAGYDWTTLWNEAKDNSKPLPQWTLALAMGVDSLESRNANIYKKYLKNAKAGNIEDQELLLNDVSTCTKATTK